MTHVGSLINWLRPYYIKNICQKERNVCIYFGHEIAVDITKYYNSLFSVSILAIIFSNSPKRSSGELGGRYQVLTRNGVLSGLLIWTKDTTTHRCLNHLLHVFNTAVVIKIGAQVNINTTTIPSDNFTIFSDQFKAR